MRFGELRMSRWLKAVPLTLALAALIIFATSCSSSAPAQIRFVNAIQDADPLDINVTGPDSKSIEEFTNVDFLGCSAEPTGLHQRTVGAGHSPSFPDRHNHSGLHATR